MDGTQADQGIFGGASGGYFDLDFDGYPNWFWPGTLYATPTGFQVEDFDRLDSDITKH